MAKSQTPKAEKGTEQSVSAASDQSNEKPTRKRAAPKKADGASAPKEKAAPRAKAPAKEKGSSKRASAKQGGAPSAEDIARRAHELFEKRGGEHGYHHEDWFEAERQLREGSAKR